MDKDLNQERVNFRMFFDKKLCDIKVEKTKDGKTVYTFKPMKRGD